MADNYPHGLFSWADLSSPDPGAASEFYCALFGWAGSDQVDPVGNYVYTLFTKDGRLTAGLGAQPEALAGMPAMWMSYINVHDVDRVFAAALDAGATALLPVMDVMESGRMAFLLDPGGATVGLWQPGTHPGAEVFNVPGAMTWNELVTRDTTEAMAFYGGILPWEFEEYSDVAGDEAAGAGLEYWLIKLRTKVAGDGTAPDHFNGGIMPMEENWPSDVPPHWMVYFLVADADATAARAAALGGSLIVGPFDTSVGRMAVLNDPQGGSFSVMASPVGE